MQGQMVRSRWFGGRPEAESKVWEGGSAPHQQTFGVLAMTKE
jgi:hypothetical protein